MVAISTLGPIVALLFSMVKARHDHAAAVDQIKNANGILELTALANKHVDNDWTWTFWPTVIACVWLVGVAIFSVGIAHKEDEEIKAQRDPSFLLGPLYLLLASIKRSKAMTDADLVRFRATIFRVLGDEHEQVIPYVGWSADHDERHAGRKWNNAKGLVGKVIHLTQVDPNPVAQAFLAQVGTGVTEKEAFCIELVKNYGYSIEEARQREPMRLSSLAITIMDGKAGLVGVVYCDSSERDFFDSNLQNMALDTSIAIANLVRRMDAA